MATLHEVLTHLKFFAARASSTLFLNACLPPALSTLSAPQNAFCWADESWGKWKSKQASAPFHATKCERGFCSGSIPSFQRCRRPRASVSLISAASHCLATWFHILACTLKPRLDSPSRPLRNGPPRATDTPTHPPTHPPLSLSCSTSADAKKKWLANFSQALCWRSPPHMLRRSQPGSLVLG